MTKTLLTLCFGSLLLAACGGETIKVNPPPPPDSYMVCEELPTAPDLAPLEAITLDDGRLVYLKAQVDARDGSIARYIVSVRKTHFECWNNAQAIKDYYESSK